MQNTRAVKRLMIILRFVCFFLLVEFHIAISVFFSPCLELNMHYQSLLGYLIVIVFTMTIVLAQANKEREDFADLLQKRKHLNGYWVGKRYIIDDEPNLDSGKQTSRRRETRSFFARSRR